MFHVLYPFLLLVSAALTGLIVYAKKEIVKMKPGDRMIRLGLGQHGGIWFFRIDLWFFGIRVSER